jgi:O-antigen/teichoic acid export membrane protein
VGLRFVEIALLSVFKAFERFDVYSRMTMISKNSVMLMSLLLVINGHGLLTIFVATVLVNLFNIIIQLIALHSRTPGILSFPSLVFLREKVDHLNHHLWYWLQSAIALMGFLADKFIVALIADVATLGYYSIATMIGSQIHNFFLSFGSFAFPRVSYRLAAKSSIAPLYFIARSLVAIPGWIIIAALLLFGDFVFKAWLGPTTYEHSIFFIKMYLVFEAAMLLIIVPYYFINGSRMVRLNSAFEAFIRTSHILAMVVGYYLSGVDGILYGLIISTFLNIPFQYYFFHKKVLHDDFKMEHIWILVPVFFMLGIVLTGGAVMHLALIAGLIISCKLIYFDPTRLHTAHIFPFTVFSKS